MLNFLKLLPFLAAMVLPLVLAEIIDYTTQKKTSISQVNANHFSMEPASLVLNDLDDGLVIGIKWRGDEPPPVDVVVNLGASAGIKLSVCSVTFTRANWNITQPVFVDADPKFVSDQVAASTSTNRTGLFIEGWVENIALQNEIDSARIDVVRVLHESQPAYGWGDPHYKTLDGYPFDFQGVGTYYFLKSDRLVIQTYNYPCNNRVTCQGGVAIQYENETIILSSLQNPVQQNKIENSNFVFRGTSTLDKIAVCVNDIVTNPKTYDLYFPDSSKVQVTFVYWTKWYYADVHVWLPSKYYRRTWGLMGTLSGDIYDDLLGPDRSTLYSVTDRFAKAWAVNDTENLFQRCLPGSGSDCSTSLGMTPGGPGSIYCPLPSSGSTQTPDAGGSSGSSSGTSTPQNFAAAFKCPSSTRPKLTNIAAYSAPKFNTTIPQANGFALLTLAKRSVDDNATQTPAQFEDDAERLCKQALDIPECTGALINLEVQTKVASCVTDAVTSGVLDHIDSYKVSFLQMCQGIINSQIRNTEDTTQLQQLSDLQSSLGFGSNRCPGQSVLADGSIQMCSGHGACLDSSCVCDALDGYTGLACNIYFGDTPQPAKGGYGQAYMNRYTWGIYSQPQSPSAFVSQLDEMAGYSQNSAFSIPRPLSMMILALLLPFVLA